MTETTVDHVDADRIDDMTPPPGTAIVRPLRHVEAVRERYLQRFTDPARLVASRSTRAWAWALGETATAPVTDHETAAPPSRSEIEAQIEAADERRLDGDRENRADAAAAILRWLIGEEDHVPLRGPNIGELVGGFGDIVRTRKQIADILALATEDRRQTGARTRDLGAGPANKRSEQRDADYLGGMIATLEWVLGQHAEAPITLRRHAELTSKELKAERLHADDMVEQARQPRTADQPMQRGYGEGVRSTITWLLGDCTTPPVRRPPLRPRPEASA